MKYLASILYLSATLLWPTISYANNTPQKEWQFRVFLDKKEIGYHNFQLTKQNGQSVIQTEAAFDINILFINAFTYRHNNTEYWQGDCLNQVSAKTVQNKKQFFVSAQADNNQLVVSNNNGKQILNNCVRSFAYWDFEMMNSEKLLNSQTGEYESVRLEYVGEDTVTVNELPVKARRYELDTKSGVITLWYEWQNAHWLALEAPAKGNRTIRYQPTLISYAETAQNSIGN